MTPASDSSRPALAMVQAYFGPRAADWEARFARDQPTFERVVADLAPTAGASVLDVGSGTGRALPPLRRAIGPRGRLVAVDATPEMVAEARRLGRAGIAHLVVADANHVPLTERAFDLIFAGGLLPHLDDPAGALAELARVARPGARLAVFHVLGRVELAARHGGVPSDDDVLAPRRLGSLLAAAGWRLESSEDGERYLVVAARH